MIADRILHERKCTKAVHFQQPSRGLVAEKCIPPQVVEDAMHIAIAAVHGVDYLITWNFKHIANPILQERIAIFLEARGYLIPFICSPQELLGENDDALN